jgi:hypothetical protein
LPPAQPRVDQTPGGNQRTWSQLPPAPGQKVSDWLYLELDTLAPGWRGAMVGLALAFLGLIWLRRPPVRDLASSAEVKSREVPACSEAPAKPDASSSSEDSSSMP